METTQRKVPIIAVFGSSGQDTLELAKLIGSGIAKKVGIVLTGGEGRNGKAVKEMAIAGAEIARDEGCLGPWIGVSRGASRPGFRSDNDKCFVIQTNLNHKRNYLEAYLCDAAIGLQGGEGTLSEVTFCLSLQKPVVLIGDWETNYPLDQPGTANKLVKKSFDRVGRHSSGNSTLDELLIEERILTKLQESLPAYNYYPMPKEQDRLKITEDVTSDVLMFLEPFRKTGFKGKFPDLEGYETVKSEYDVWLRRIEERLTASA